MKTTMKTSIKSWYIKKYPDDELGYEIDHKITFEDLHKTLKQGFSVYETLDVWDSLVREACFEELARLLNLSYEDIYRLWQREGVESIFNLYPEK